MRHHTVGEIMRRQTVVEAAPGACVRDVIRLMAERNLGSILVTENGRLLGIFTERDALRRVMAPGRDPDLTILAEVMTREPDTIRARDSVDNAIRRMDEFGYRHLPVLDDDDRVIGVLSIRDCSIDDLAAMRWELEERHAFAERAW